MSLHLVLLNLEAPSSREPHPTNLWDYKPSNAVRRKGKEGKRGKEAKKVDGAGKLVRGWSRESTKMASKERQKDKKKEAQV